MPEAPVEMNPTLQYDLAHPHRTTVGRTASDASMTDERHSISDHRPSEPTSSVGKRSPGGDREPDGSRRHNGIRRGVIGILCRGDRYLLIRRAPGVALGRTWCFPGGHVERGENARRAIVREMHEELGIEVTPVHRLGAVKGRPDVMLAIWIVEHTGGRLQPNPSEVSDTRWYSGDQIRRLPDGLPSNHRVVDLLEARRKNHGE